MPAMIRKSVSCLHLFTDARARHGNKVSGVNHLGAAGLLVMEFRHG